MADIATLWDVSAGRGDWALSLPKTLIWTDENGRVIIDQNGLPVDFEFTPGTGLQEDASLYSAVLISLFTDAQADDDDALPDPRDNDPRGWWGGPIGSKIWLRLRSRANAQTLALVKHDIEQALAWLIEDDVAASITVTTEWTKPRMLGARVLILRTNGTRRALAFSQVWENL